MIPAAVRDFVPGMEATCSRTAPCPVVASDTQPLPIGTGVGGRIAGAPYGSFGLHFGRAARRICYALADQENRANSASGMVHHSYGNGYQTLPSFVSWLRSASVKLIEDLVASLASLLLLFVIFLVVTFPVTWLLMLFLGNVGQELSYWGTLPLGTVVSLLIGATSSSAYRYR